MALLPNPGRRFRWWGGVLLVGALGLAPPPRKAHAAAEPTSPVTSSTSTRGAGAARSGGPRATVFGGGRAIAPQPAPSPDPRSSATGSPNRDRDQAIAEADALYSDLEYGKANRKLADIVRRGGLGHGQLCKVYELLGLTHAALDNATEAQLQFENLLACDPNFALPNGLSPKLSRPFDAAKEAWRKHPSRPGLETTANIRGRDYPSVRVVLRDPRRETRQVVVYWRWTPTDTWQEQRVSPSQSPQDVPISARPSTSTRLDYFVQGLDERGSALFENGSEGVPKTAGVDDTPVAPTAAGGEASASWTSNPWIWVAGGVVLAGAAVGSYVLLSKGSDSGAPPRSTLLTPVLLCGGDRACSPPP